eukprot:6363874-Amphidinium_carterae.1
MHRRRLTRWSAPTYAKDILTKSSDLIPSLATYLWFTSKHFISKDHETPRTAPVNIPSLHKSQTSQHVVSWFAPIVAFQ